MAHGGLGTGCMIFWVVGVIDLSDKMKFRSRYGEFEREGDFGCGLSRYCVVLDLT